MDAPPYSARQFIFPLCLVCGLLTGFVFSALWPEGMNQPLMVLSTILFIAAAFLGTGLKPNKQQGVPKPIQTCSVFFQLDFPIAMSSLLIGILWTQTALENHQKQAPKQSLIGKAILVEGTVLDTFPAKHGFGTQMARMRVLQPQHHRGDGLPDMTVYYPSDPGLTFQRGQRAKFWLRIRKQLPSRPVPSSFEDWMETFNPRYTGSIKDIRLIRTPLIAWRDHADLNKGNRELIRFFFRGSPSHTWRERLRPFGVGHLLSVSGLHCGLFYLLLRIALLGLRRPLSRTAIIAFALMGFASWMGWSASVTRAALMLIAWECMPLLNIKRDWLRIWWGLLLFLLLENPIIILSKGFWYTFAASLGLVAGHRSPRLLEHPYLTRIRWVLPILAAQIIVLPINLMFFGTARPLSILWNLVGLLFLSILFVLFLASLLATAWPIFAVIPNSWDRILGDQLAHLGSWSSSIDLYRFPAHPLIILLAISLSTIVLFKVRREWRWYGSLLLLALFIQFKTPIRSEKLVMLDVGQGQSLLLTDSNGSATLFDCGGVLGGGWEFKTLLRLYGATNLEQIFISHANLDHMSLLNEPNWIDDANIFTSSLQISDLLNKAALPLAQTEALKRGTTWIWKGWTIETLWPEAQKAGSWESNDSGLVLSLRNERIGLMVMGDAGIQVEQEIVDLLPIEGQAINLLQVGHHGSRTATGTPFLERIKPSLALISCGRSNRFAHPHPQVLNRLEQNRIPHLSTAKQGTLLVDFADETVWSSRLGDHARLKMKKRD